MAVEILMPALSPTMTEGNLVKWLKKEGDEVSSGDVLAEIETDKATMEVEAVDEGKLAKILIKEGSEAVKVNEVIALLLEEGDDESELDSLMSKGKKPSSSPQSQEKAVEKETPQKEKSQKPQESKAAGGRVFASPLARRMASQKGVDLGSVSGSGPRGRVVKADVLAAEGGTAPQAQARTFVPLGQRQEVERVDLSGMRKVIAQRLTESKQEVPHFYLTVSCELDTLLKVRSRMNKQLEAQGIKLSVNDFVVKATAQALMEVPDANVTWGGDHILRYPHADVAVAVAVDGGLYTPIVAQAEQKSLSQISAEVKALAKKAKEGKLQPEEYQGGTFSVSNLGMYGVDQFQAIINPPQACILAVGAGQQKVVPVDGAPQVRTVMECTLSVDHRAVDGALGAQWLQAFKRYIEDPAMMLA